MTLTTGTAGPLLTPEQVESLLIKPVLAASVALNPLCSRVLRPTPPPSGCPPSEWSPPSGVTPRSRPTGRCCSGLRPGQLPGPEPQRS